MSQGARTLIVGLDGATFDVIRPLVEAGRLPNLAHLIKNGAHAPLCSTTPAMTLPAWSSILTGCNPGKHGIFDFVHRRPGRYALDFINSSWRRVPTLHEWISQLGGRVASVAVPTTYPPQAVNGVVISGFDSPIATSIDRSFIYPNVLAGEVFSRFGGMKFADFQELHIGPGWHAKAMAALLGEIERKRAICEWLLGRERWDLFMVVFGETDTVSHHFWMFRDAHGPRYPGDEVARPFRNAIDRVYERCDQALGRLLDRAGAERVALVSDHGFGGAGTRAIYLNRFLESRGWLHFRGSDGATGGAGLGRLGRIRSWALEHLPEHVQEQLVRRLPSAAISGVEAMVRWGSIDFNKTSAWSDELNYAATLHLNVAGREPLGVVVDRMALVAALRSELLAWRIDGQRVVERVWTREEVYSGDAVEEAPDLLLDLTLPDGYSWTLLPSTSVSQGINDRMLTGEEFTGGKGRGMNGSHRQHGVLVLHGGGVAAGVGMQAGVSDVAPTLLAAAGWPIPDHVDGRILHAAFVAPLRASYREGRTWAPTSTPMSAGQQASLRERLQTLGYF